MTSSGIDVETSGSRQRRSIAFFDYPDVFEDFWQHYGLKPKEMVESDRLATGHYLMLELLQQHVGNVNWYIFSLSPGLRPGRHKNLGCEITFLRSSWIHRVLWHAYWLPNSAWRWRGADRYFRKLHHLYATISSYTAPFSHPFFKAIRRDRPDVIFVQSYSSGRFDVLWLISRLLGIPIIAYHAGGQHQAFLGRAMKRWTLRRADRIIAPIRKELDVLSDRYGVPGDRLVEMPVVPIDSDIFCRRPRNTACRAAGFDPARRYVLYVGRLDDGIKRVSAIIRVFSRLRDAHPDVDLLVAGEGPDRGMLEELARNVAPDRVTFLGWVSDTDRKVDLYNIATCLVLASRVEGIPAVVAEAMMCGTPVVATRVGGIPELIRNGETGWMVKSGDTKALHERLEHVLADSEGAEKLGSEARKFVEHSWSKGALSAGLKDCFAEVLA